MRPAVTLGVAVVALAWLALPELALAHDCFSMDEFKECLRSEWGWFLGSIAAAALGVTGMAIFMANLAWEAMFDEIRRQEREKDRDELRMAAWRQDNNMPGRARNRQPKQRK
jgi:hypothetical protein